MNIDERLDRLTMVVERMAEDYQRFDRFVERMTERHEALSQAVELLVSMHKEHESQIETNRHEFQEHKRLVTGAIESIAETNRRLATLMVKMDNEQARQSAEQARLSGEQQQDRKEFRDVMMRLSVIAEAHQDSLDDHEKRFGGNSK